MKISTRQYAKRQVKWLRGKLLPAVVAEKSRASLCGDDPQVSMYVLDATGVFINYDTGRITEPNS
jgi:tRNA dimethylallyltransferase